MNLLEYLRTLGTESAVKVPSCDELRQNTNRNRDVFAESLSWRGGRNRWRQ